MTMNTNIKIQDATLKVSDILFCNKMLCDTIAKAFIQNMAECGIDMVFDTLLYEKNKGNAGAFIDVSRKYLMDEMAPEKLRQMALDYAKDALRDLTEAVLQTIQEANFTTNVSSIQYDSAGEIDDFVLDIDFPPAVKPEAKVVVEAATTEGADQAGERGVAQRPYATSGI